MRTTDAERRAFLKSLKPRLVAIAEAVAEQTGPIDPSELRARVQAGREEFEQERLGMLAEEHAVLH